MRTNIFPIIAIIAIAFMATSCQKENEALPQIQTVPSFSKVQFVKATPEQESLLRLSHNPWQIQAALLPPYIDSVYINDVTQSKIQLLERFYWVNDTMSYMQVDCEDVNSGIIYPLTIHQIPGPGYWQVILDIPQLMFGSTYRIRVRAWNSHGPYASNWQTVTTLP